MSKNKIRKKEPLEGTSACRLQFRMNLVSSLQSTRDFQNNKTLQGGLIFICGLCQLMTASLLEIEDSYSAWVVIR